LTGIDGAGKTTLGRCLVEELALQGFPAVYVYGRVCPLISRATMVLGRSLLLRQHNPQDNYPAYAREKQRVMQRRLLAWGYRIAVLADAYVQIWWKLVRYGLGRRIVVCDRYIYDTVISDLAAHLAYTGAQTRVSVERCLRFVPLPALTLLIDLDEEIAFARKRDVLHLDYLRERRGRYQTLIERPEVVMVSGVIPTASLAADIAMRYRQQLEEGAYARTPTGH
jgi:dTMP kinase